MVKNWIYNLNKRKLIKFITIKHAILYLYSLNILLLGYYKLINLILIFYKHIFIHHYVTIIIINQH